MARQIDTDIIVWGGTHNVEAFTLEDKFFINPGSCTGAFNSDWVWEEEPIDDDTNTNTNITVQQKSDEIEKDTIKEEEEEVKNESVTEEERKSEIEDKSGKDEASTTEQENQNLENTKKDTLSSDSDQKDEDEFENGLSSMPSFCLLDIQNNTCTVYIYTLVDNEVKVDKVKYEKS
ncbi:uncharacterized protein SCODWIG_03226 [Saccharomycodes ludwigii]|uniref:Vacuolar protein sorting-associated protein 29 n=2 Tax=Saccharomycodes ludwigii TaxID=36035 RepID=A0A376B9V5_9ASCO|nr:uncharacterized protein SCODWIG_03226 [Saccharomycodes ludwigii]